MPFADISPNTTAIFWEAYVKNISRQFDLDQFTILFLSLGLLVGLAVN